MRLRNLLVLIAIFASLVALGCWDNRLQMARVIDQGYAVNALKTPEVLEALKKFGSEPVGSSPEEFGPAFAAEVTRFKKIVADLKLPPQD